MSQREWMEKDYYKVLGLTKDASKEDIKKAYRKLAQRYHPDANKGDAAAEARFKEISEARSILSNDSKRAEYDQMRSFVEAGGQRFYGFQPGGGQGNVRVNIGDLGDIFGGGGGGGFFEDLLGGMGGRGRAGADAETEVSLSFDDAIRGTTVALNDGSRVRIPAGVGEGARIKVTGKGQAGLGGGRAGDLYVRVHVVPHPVFQMGKNGDLTVRLPVTYTEAALGAKVEVPTLDQAVTVKIPPGTPDGKKLRVKGKGSPKRGGGLGDLLVQIEVQVPQKLSRAEKEALQRFAEVHEGTPRAHLETYMARGKAKEAS
jgi:molecular chaperone DnaJ